MIALFGGAIFVAAGLVFLVQPMIAKAMLPTFGGAPQVWTASMVFFQAALLAGYSYAHLATQHLRLRRQAGVHIGLLILPVLALPIALKGTDAAAGMSPAFGVIVILALSVGLPYVVVTATSPLLQRWFSSTGHRAANDPYFLYAAGNAGSLLGLLLYPFLVEPWLAVHDQGLLWSAGYILFAVLCGTCALVMARRGVLVYGPNGPVAVYDPNGPVAGASSSAELVADEGPAPTVRRRAGWTFCAFVPASLLLGVTTHLQTDIAAVPLLWVIPLAIYLVTFILAFSPRRIFPAQLAGRLLPFFVVATFATIVLGHSMPIWLSMLIGYSTFFVASMLAHGQLADDRPGPSWLTRFFLLIAVGGVLGGIFNALVAPAFFDQVLEYPILLVAALLLRRMTPAAAAADQADPAWLRRARLLDIVVPAIVTVVVLIGLVAVRATGLPISGATVLAVVAAGSLVFVRRPVRFALTIGALFLITFLAGASPLFADRTFFGVHRVIAEGDRHIYLSGATIHGAELTTPDGAVTPLSYYHRTGPAGQVFAMLGQRGTPVQDVGVIGLGAGALSAYGEKGQAFTFYEIDPVVIRIASDPSLFTYVRDSKATVHLIEGDGRLRIAEAPDDAFDVIVLDAFSSDAIPAHLVTREAFQLYEQKLRPRGVILAHVTNSYLDVRAVVAGGAQSVGMVGLAQTDADLAAAPPDEKQVSNWVVLARTPVDLGALVDDPRWMPLDELDRTVLWTDDFSDILSVLHP
ncbi:MAG: fused MFS/spermidine synthase [Chloroflexi bacterium]|nr:fused MFS/spermidine synthase [Chloroflexota bacterium]